jgi:deoxyribodipyrimidine photolyase
MATKTETQHYEKGLFVFHRDLRVEDNVGLLRACAQCERVYTCFIFTPEQISARNTYRSKRAIQFMCESLADLNAYMQKHARRLQAIHTERYQGNFVAFRTILEEVDSGG